MLNNYKDLSFEELELEIGGEVIKGLFAELRISKDTVPEGKYMYQLRHGDDDSLPCTLENKVVVNFYGTFITDKEIHIKDYLDIDDWGFLGTVVKGDN